MTGDNMDKLQLQDIYSFGEVVPSPLDNAIYLNIPLDGNWFALPKAQLTDTEINLLTALFLEKNDVTINDEQHPWYGFLFEGKPIENVAGSYRIIQFNLVNPNQKQSRQEWLDAFSSMFNKVADAFFLTESYGIIVEEKSKSSYSLEELEGILLTLESDFIFKTKAFLGSFLNVSDGFPRFFQEEKQIFLEELPNIKSKSAFSLSQVALHFFTKNMVKKSLIMQIFKKKLSIDGEMQDIITALWNNQGNISSTAKELFMHRNTLQYRLEKFHEQTGLSLKSMDDLVLSYLLVA